MISGIHLATASMDAALRLVKLPSTSVLAGDGLMLQQVRSFIHDQKGATAIEYGLIVSLIFLAIIVGVQGVANKTVNMYDLVRNSI